jgi:predicted nucleic acid-binding protein
LTLLDAYTVIAYLRDEAAAEEAGPLIISGAACITATCVGEVFDQLVRVDGMAEEDVALDLAQLGLLDAVPVDSLIGIAAGRLRARHYHRSRRSVSMADCQTAAVARSVGEPVATSDPALLDLCHAEGIDVIALPGRDGARWEPPAER